LPADSSSFTRIFAALRTERSYLASCVMPETGHGGARSVAASTLSKTSRESPTYACSRDLALVPS